MGCFVSKDKLTKEDMDFLKTHTSYDETTIKEWYKGFKVSACFDWYSSFLRLNWKYTTVQTIPNDL